MVINRQFNEYCYRMFQASDRKLSVTDFRRMGKKWGILSPITLQWIEFEIHKKWIHSKTIPNYVQEIIDYCAMQKDLLSRARIFRPFHKELLALDKEESQLFGSKYIPPKRKR